MILKIRLVAAKRISDAERFNLEFSDPSEITQIADKLRWYRYQKGLLQENVADYVGMERSTYSGYEEYGRDRYPIEKMLKIAELLEVPVEELLDEYNRFLYHGQGRQIKELRDKLHLTQKELAERMETSVTNIKKWEQDRVKMQKSTWEKYFKEKA